MHETAKSSRVTGRVTVSNQNVVELWDNLLADEAAIASPPAADSVEPAPKQPVSIQKQTSSTLVNRNIIVAGRRTSTRLEPMMWDALEEICARENVSMNTLCDVIEQRRQASSLTAAIRVYVMAYFRTAATEEGHACIGHGVLYGNHRGPIGTVNGKHQRIY